MIAAPFTSRCGTQTKALRRTTGSSSSRPASTPRSAAPGLNRPYHLTASKERSPDRIVLLAPAGLPSVLNVGISRKDCPHSKSATAAFEQQSPAAGAPLVPTPPPVQTPHG